MFRSKSLDDTIITNIVEQAAERTGIIVKLGAQPFGRVGSYWQVSYLLRADNDRFRKTRVPPHEDGKPLRRTASVCWTGMIRFMEEIYADLRAAHLEIKSSLFTKETHECFGDGNGGWVKGKEFWEEYELAQHLEDMGGVYTRMLWHPYNEHSRCICRDRSHPECCTRREDFDRILEEEYTCRSFLVHFYRRDSYRDKVEDFQVEIHDRVREAADKRYMKMKDKGERS